MTVSSTTARKTFTGDGATTSFATSPMVFFAAADLTVYVVTTATGAATTLTLNTHYTVSGGSGSTGTVNFAGGSAPYGAPSAAQAVVIVRELDRVQEVDFVDNEASDAEVMEDALDKLTMMIQEVDARVARSITLADSDVSSATATLPTPEASSLIGWNSTGTALQNYAGGDIDPDILVSTFMETVLDDTTAAAARTTLGLGTMAVEANPLTTNGDLLHRAGGALARLPATATVAAHATTMDPWGARVVTLSGSAVTFTDIADADYVGQSVLLIMNAAHVWTDGAVFDVQGGADYTCAAGDQVLLVATAVDAFDVTIFPASGQAVVSSAVQVKVGAFTRDVSTASGTQAITGVGFQPKAVIFFGAFDGTVSHSAGVDDGTTARSLYMNQPAAVANFGIGTTASIYPIQAGGSGTGQASSALISSLDSDGFTLTWTKTGSPTGTASFFYLAIG